MMKTAADNLNSDCLSRVIRTLICMKVEQLVQSTQELLKRRRDTTAMSCVGSSASTRSPSTSRMTAVSVATTMKMTSRSFPRILTNAVPVEKSTKAKVSLLGAVKNCHWLYLFNNKD